jgi:threonine aldolase
MNSLTRRSFVQAGIAAALAGSASSASAERAQAHVTSNDRVDFTGDGVPLSPAEYAQLLARLATPAIELDEYSRGGPVAAMERQFATLLGKEAAVFMPSGTLANHLAVRALAGSRRRVVVQERSHFYNDSGDCAQQLSALTLLPLAAGLATFTWDDVAAELARASSGRVSTEIGAISIESPVRRCTHAMFDIAAMQHISAEARQRGIGLHLDGARLFVAAAYSGRAIAEYTSLFDTVYVSLWKCFNSANGAILAGPRALIENMFQARRMFGGAMRHAWPDALVAGHYADGYLERLSAAVAVANKVWDALGANPRFVVERIPEGTSALRMTIKDVAPGEYQARLARRGVQLPDPQGDVFTLHVNETAARWPAARLELAFNAALAPA